MIWAERIRTRLVSPGARRWLIAGGAVLILHVLVLSVLPPNPKLDRYQSATPRVVEPIYLYITPDARPARTPPVQAGASAVPRALNQPPIAIRPARPTASPLTVPPLVVETPPPAVRPRAPGRVVPQSWRNRCGLGDGEVSESAWQACRDSFLQAVNPTSPPVRPRGDPGQDFAAQGAARSAANAARRAPAPTGSGNVRPSSTPGSNFGMGDIDHSIIYPVGERPEVNGGID